MDSASDEWFRGRKMKASYTRDANCEWAEGSCMSANRISSADQIAFRKLQEHSSYADKNHRPYNMVNILKDIWTHEEVDAAWEELKGMYDEQVYTEEERQLNGFEIKVRYLERAVSVDSIESIHIRHVLLPQ